MDSVHYLKDRSLDLNEAFFSEVWIVYGDGSLGYSVAEFDTFTRHKVTTPF